ncbi:hypothetical protein POM88_045969 [Heracleum sosnowskyi]|uniref:F-box domain-containing protein n=1 Tax=Heracleum sosnowskyi TaxID=360622 RepID=A0AAD8H8E8_9APIA|nr:hypothetical protein POM88_045969 [Heracleum sosnowskyi]
MKKVRTEDKDRISKLPDDLIHRVMSLLDTRLAVQTSVLSKRWKYLWTTLPFLSFNGYNEHYKEELRKFIYSKFISHVFSNRNHNSRILNLELCPSNGLNLRFVKKYVKYAISHDVERLHVISDRYCPLSMFRSNSLKELKLTMEFESIKVMESDCWRLLYLTTLRLKCTSTFCYYDYGGEPTIPESCLICLPALTTLGLVNFILPKSFNLPNLETLCLESCTLPQNVWNLPALLTLELTHVDFPENASDYFLALASLQNLAIDLARQYIEHCETCVISSPQLVNMKIRAAFDFCEEYKPKIKVVAPKLCNFSSIGFFWIIFQSCNLENANIKFWDSVQSWVLKENRKLLKSMFSQLGSAKTLTLDMVTLQALSGISNRIVTWRCPFYNLKYLKLPPGCEETSISSIVRQYLLGGSPSAIIVKTCSRENVNPQMAAAVPAKAQNEVLEKSFATPTKELFDFQYAQHNACGNCDVDMLVRKEHMLEPSEADACKVRQIRGPATRSSNDEASPSGNQSYLVLWRGHEVSSEYVTLLELIMKRYPETFEQLPRKNKKILTMKLNMLCSSVNALTKTAITEIYEMKIPK